MAGVAKDVLARLKVDGRKWKQGLDKANKQLGKFGTGAQKTLGFIRNHWMAITAAVVATGVAMRAALRPAMEWEDAQIRMKVVAQGNVITLEKMRGLIDSESGGMFSRADTAAALNYAKAVGFNIDQAGKLLPLLKDTAAVYGEDLKTAMMAVVRASLFGEAELAERIGLTLRENAIMDTTMRLYGKRLSQLNKEQKIIAVVTAATEQLKRVKGGEAEATTTATGATKRLGIQTKEFLTNELEPATGVIADLANRFADLTEGINEARNAYNKKWDTNDKATLAERMSDKIQWAMGTETYGSFEAQTKKTMRRWENVRKFGSSKGFFGEGGGDMFPGMGMGMSQDRLRAMQTAWEQGGAVELRYKAFLAKYFPADPLPGEFEEFVARRNREMSASLSVVGAVGGPPDPHRIAGIDPGALTNLSGASAERIRLMQNESEIEQMVMDDRAAAWERYGWAAQSAVEGITNATEVMLTKYLMGEVSTHKKTVALWKWAGKSFSASIIRAIADAAKQKAAYHVLEAIGATASATMNPFGHMKAAAGFAGLAGVAGGVAGAMEQGAANEMKAFGETGIYGESSSNRITGTTSGNRGGISATIARSPEVVNYNTTIIFEGPVYGTPQETYELFLRESVNNDIRTGEIQIPGVAA